MQCNVFKAQVLSCPLSLYHLLCTPLISEHLLKHWHTLPEPLEELSLGCHHSIQNLRFSQSRSLLVIEFYVKALRTFYPTFFSACWLKLGLLNCQSCIFVRGTWFGVAPKTVNTFQQITALTLFRGDNCQTSFTTVRPDVSKTSRPTHSECEEGRVKQRKGVGQKWNVWSRRPHGGR